METNKLGEHLWSVHLEYMRALDYVVDRSYTRGESGVLLYLYHISRPLYPGELTEKLGLTTGRIANILRALEREGLVVRTPDIEDKRRVQVALTPAGEVEAEAQNRAAIAFHEKLLSNLEPGEAEQFLNVLIRLARKVEENFLREDK